MKKSYLTFLVLLVSLLILPMEKAFAASEKDNVDYSVQPILPNNQLDRGKTFFDLRVKPGDKQELKVQINNYSKKEQKYFISINTAETNGNLTIDYTRSKLPKNSPNQQPISQYVDYPKEVTVPAEKAGLVTINLQVPKKKFEGILLGGIQVKKDFSQEEDQIKQAIKSEYDYILGLMLSEDDQAVKPDLKLVNLEPEIISNNAGLTVQLKNTQPINISEVHMISNIFEDNNQEKKVMTREIKSGSIAPLSLFKINLFNGKAGATKPLKAGDYFMTMTVGDDAYHKWYFEKKFTITEKEATSVNNKVFKVKSDNTLLYLIIGILLAILVFFIILMLVKRRKKEE